MTSTTAPITIHNPLNFDWQHLQVLSWMWHQQQSANPDISLVNLQQTFPELNLPEVMDTLQASLAMTWDGERGWLDEELIPLPVIGQVAAGVPIEAIENQEAQRLAVPLTLFRQRPTYLLRVRGDSMKDAGICDGDLIAVRKTGQSQTGRIVVARVGNEVTVKQLRVEKNRIALLPANDAYEPLWVAPDDLIIEGEFVGLIRGGHTLH